MSTLAYTLFDVQLQEIVNEVAVLAEQQTQTDAYAQREFVADEILKRLRKEYPSKGINISVALTWKGVHAIYEVTVIVGNPVDQDHYTTTVYAELNGQKKLVVNKEEDGFADVVKAISDKAFKFLIEVAVYSTHEMVLRSEELIKKGLADHYEGLEEDFEVNVTAGVGKDLSFRINVEDVRIGQIHEYTIIYSDYEKQEHPMQPTVKETIDPTPITQKQRGRSEKTLILTMATNRAFTDAFLEHEHDSTADEFAKNIRTAVLKQLGEQFPADDYTVRTECTEDMVATVWVEAPGITQIRLRGHRAKTETQPA